MIRERELGAALADLSAGRSSNAFAHLGPHPRGDRSGITIRALYPAATEAAVLLPASGRVVPMQRDGHGIFVATVDGPAVPDYRLRVLYPGHDPIVIDDPYRYGRVLTDFDLHLIAEGTHERLCDKLGAHRVRLGEAVGVHFAVWAPNARRVSVIGDFNGWDGRVHPMRLLNGAGVWEIFIPGILDGEKYKFEVLASTGELVAKSDPFGVSFERPPHTASIVRELAGYEWSDAAWCASRRVQDGGLDRPMAIYEVHLGSWARVPEDGDRSLTYRELAERLVPYVKDLGFTHVELLPVMEHPFTGSWGYQVLGFFAPTSRYGTPGDFKYFVDVCHQHGLGVILDWVPGHFPRDEHGLARFDGTALYEHDDPRQGVHRDWGTLVFNYGRSEVRNFLAANALFWLEEYHVDGLRVDAVASMLYLDYSRGPGEWIPNHFGGRENFDAVEFLKQLNVLTHLAHPGTLMIAEESTAWPGVSRPVHLGGLGFTFKWNLGWMHDVLEYVRQDPVHRPWAHTLLTFSMLYAYSENFVLPLSHDEVVHGKRSLLDKMPGDRWQKFASLRLLYGFMYGHPGKKLVFMGGEFGQWREWDHDRSLDWHLLQEADHAGLQRYVQALNWHLGHERALHERDVDPDGFQWIDCHDHAHSVFSFLRFARDRADFVVVVFNFTPVPRNNYRIGVPSGGRYVELLNSDSALYGGSNVGNDGGVSADAIPTHGLSHSLALSLPPLGCLLLKLQQA